MTYRVLVIIERWRLAISERWLQAVQLRSLRPYSNREETP